jgi:general stress protein 26
MLNTRTDGDRIAGRPMSNNRDVAYDGDSWFFLTEDTRAYADVRRDPKVTLTVQGNKGLLGKPPIFLSIEGDAEIVRERAALSAHWTSDLKRWWPEGVETPGLALVKVRATRIHYWNGEDEGEVAV